MTLYLFLLNTAGKTESDALEIFANGWANDNPEGDLCESEAEAQARVDKARESVMRAQAAVKTGTQDFNTVDISRWIPGYFKIRLSAEKID